MIEERVRAIGSLFFIVALSCIVVYLAWKIEQPAAVTEKMIVRTVEVPRHILSREEVNAAIRDRINSGRADLVLEITAGICPDPGLAYLIICFALVYDVPAPLLFALVSVESSFDPLAESKAGALGLMQLLPSTFKGYTREQLEDPQVNLRLGCEHLLHLRRKYGTWGDAIIHYNGLYTKGAGSYLVRVMEREREYERIFNEGL